MSGRSLSESSDHELVRMSRQLVDELLDGGSEPVHVIGLKRQDDGTLDMILQVPEIVVERNRLRECHKEAHALAMRYRDEMDRYRKALEEIAGQDYRGNRPTEATIAWKALNDE